LLGLVEEDEGVDETDISAKKEWRLVVPKDCISSVEQWDDNDRVCTLQGPVQAYYLQNGSGDDKE